MAGRVAPRVTISDEREALLETGGGVVKALAHLGARPFLHLNSDSLWIERGEPELEAMKRAWDPARMDMLLMLADRERSFGYDGRGDFNRAADGRLTRREADASAPFVYAGVAVMKPELFAGAPLARWSLNLSSTG